MRQNITKTLIVVAAAVALAIPLTASAHEGHVHDSPESTASNTGSERNRAKAVVSEQVDKATEAREQAASLLRQKLEAQKQVREQKSEATRTEVKQKLDDKKRKICEQRQSHINSITNKMGVRRQSSFERITKIADATDAFYHKKELAVSNYTELSAAVSAAKAAAESAITSQKAVQQFNCGSDAPRSDLANFKEKRSASIDAISAYRDAVRSLVKAVRDASVAARDQNTGDES